MRDVTAAFSAIEQKSAKMGLGVNEGKTKYMLTTSGVTCHVCGLRLQLYIYLGTAINTNNDVSLEAKRRVTLANRCYFGLNRQLSSRDLSRATALTLYKALILPGWR